MLYGSVWTNIVSFLKKEIYQLGNYHVRVLDLIITALALLVIVIGIIVVVNSVKKENRKQRDALDEGETPSKSELRKQARKERKLSKKQAKKDAKVQAKLAVKEEKILARQGKAVAKQEKIEQTAERTKAKATATKAMILANEPTDMLVAILGFDPYAPIDTSECEIAEEYHDVEQETADMRALRERLKLSAQYEKKIATLKTRLTKIRYELSKATRFIKDNRAVSESATAVCLKLTAVLDELKIDKKTAKANRAEIDKITVQLQANTRTVSDLAIAIDRRALEESKLNDAQSFVTGEIARAEYDLAFIKKEIDQLNDTVGIEVKRLEDESHAREIMARNRELSPLLIAVNSTFREIKAMDSDLEEIHSEKHAIKEKILQKKEELKVSYGANEAIQYSKIMSELNDRMIELDESEELLIKRKEEKIEEFKQAKRKAHEFLDSSSYELNDIIAVEDKVVGDLEFERVKSEYEVKRYEAQVKRSFAQKRYDILLKRKVKNSKRNSANYQAYIEELDQISTELKQANAEFEKANSDCEKVLPSISAISLVRSGSGVISRERLARKQEELRKKEKSVKAEIPAPIQEEVEEKPVEKVEQPQQERGYEERREFVQPRENRPQSRTHNYPVSAQPTAIQIRKLMARLNELERIALQEKEQRVAMRRERVRAADETNKIDRRRAQIVELRKQLDYIATENEVWKFKERLRRIVDSFDAEEASDEVLNKMVQRLMNDATRLGERLSGRNGGANGNRRR